MTTFGTDTVCEGKELYDSIVMVFMDCEAKEQLEPEDEVAAIDLALLCVPLDATKMCVKLNQYLVARKKL